MKAIDAKKIADSVNNTTEQITYDRVIEKVKEEAQKGHFSFVLWEPSFNKLAKKRLQKEGYFITEISEPGRPNGFGFKISWGDF